MNNEITKLEADFLEIIAMNEMNESNGSYPESADEVNCYLWLDEYCVDMGISINAIKGVLTSCKKKGWVRTVDEGSEDAGISFTEEGYNAFVASYKGEK